MIEERKLLDPNIIYHCTSCGYVIETVEDKVKLSTGRCAGCEKEHRKKFLGDLHIYSHDKYLG